MCPLFDALAGWSRLRSRTCFIREADGTDPELTQAIALIENVHKAVVADCEGNAVCVMYLEANYETVGATLAVLLSTIYESFEVVVTQLVGLAVVWFGTSVPEGQGECLAGDPSSMCAP